MQTNTLSSTLDLIGKTWEVQWTLSSKNFSWKISNLHLNFWLNLKSIQNQTISWKSFSQNLTLKAKQVWTLKEISRQMKSYQGGLQRCQQLDLNDLPCLQKVQLTTSLPLLLKKKTKETWLAKLSSFHDERR